jgi:hypothetical protein
VTPNAPAPLDFYAHLRWLDGRALLDTIEKYRSQLFLESLYTFDPDGRPRYNLVLSGRAKKNWKSTDLILAAFYRFFVWPSAYGNDCFLLANDEGQASDDLTLAKKLIAANPVLRHAVIVKQKEIVRKDGRGTLAILPARDVMGAHGKTYLFVGFDEIHGYRDWSLFEALAPDPTRPDSMTWITSYDTIWSTPGVPLFDLKRQAGNDPRMYFSWYSGERCTDPTFADLDPELRANPSLQAWPDGRGYLEQQRRRLPSHKFRRLHLNLPGAPDGAFLDAGGILACTALRRRRLPPGEHQHAAFVDMSGGSSDDAVVAIAHLEGDVAVLDLVEKQAGSPPFNPRQAVAKFAAMIKGYGLSSVTGDQYAGATFAHDFQEHGIAYHAAGVPKSSLYEWLEPRVNARLVELLDVPELGEQLVGLVRRGAKVDHAAGAHDDWANACAGALWLAGERPPAVDLSDAYIGRPLISSLPWEEWPVDSHAEADADPFDMLVAGSGVQPWH